MWGVNITGQGGSVSPEYPRRPPFSLGLNLNGYRGIFLTEFQFDLIFRNYLIDERLRTNIGVNFGVGLYVFCTRKTKISAIGFLEKVNTILNNNPYYGIKINLKIETPIAIHNSLEFIGIAKRSLNLFASYAPEPNLIKIGVAYGIGYDSWQKRIRGY